VAARRGKAYGRECSLQLQLSIGVGERHLFASVIAGLAMGYSVRGLLRVYWKTLRLVSTSLLTIAAMMAIGFTTRYSGMDADARLAFAKTGFCIPFSGPCSAGSALL